VRNSYPYPVVYSVESGDYRRANKDERVRQSLAQAAQADAWQAYKDDGKPDKLDRWWAARQEFVSMISRAPHGVKRGRFGPRGSLRTRHAACDTLLAVVPRGYGKRDGVIEW
jgi:hypothetical protein